MIAKIYRKAVPIELRAKIADARRKRQERLVLDRIKAGEFQEHKAECDYMIRHNEVFAMPYPWREEYRASDVEVRYDGQKGMPCCSLKNTGGRVSIYFPQNWSKGFVRRYLNAILCEQDPRSPHYYFDRADPWFDDDTIFIDAGAAEGLVALQVVDRVKKVVLLECDKVWMEPLKATFEPWKDKVTIVTKFAGDMNDDTTCTLDDLVEAASGKVAIKMDVEGNELSVLRGSEKLLDADNARAYICLYHNDADEDKIVPMMLGKGFQTSMSDSYMFYRLNQQQDYSFRHGVLRCEK